MQSRAIVLAVLLAACTGELSMSETDAATSHAPDAHFAADAHLSADAGALADAGPTPERDAGPPVDPDAGPPPIDAGPPDTRPSSARHTPRPRGTTAAGLGYYEYLPPGYPDGRDHPLLLFLHGIGENGNGTSELDRVLRNGLPRLIDRDEWPNDRPFITLSTQHAGGGCHTAAEIHAFLTYAIAEYDVDPARVYLTGLSCGAYGAWSYVGQHLDDQIAALVAIAGDGRSAWNAQGCELGRLPIWAFHGDADDVVAPSGTTTPMANLMACDPAPREARVTIYPGVGHDSWSRTYDGSAGHDIYGWLLRFTRP
jgi:predicted peptidase